MVFKIILNIIIGVIILDISKTTSIETQFILFGMTCAFLLVYSQKKRRINKYVVLLIISWYLINTLAVIFLDVKFNFIAVTRIASNYLLLAYFLVDFYGKKFLSKLESFLYFLTVLSIPLFVLNIIFVEEFNALTPFLKSFTNPQLLTNENFWSIGVYVSALSNSENIRNCGFMWEPGYFAVIITFCIIFNWLNYGIKLDRRFLLYSLAMVSTFSTAGYLSLFLLMVAYFIQKGAVTQIIFISVFCLIFFRYIYSLDFIEGKINLYFETVETQEFNYIEQYKAVKLNRFEIALYDIKRVARYPLGFGYYDRFSFDNFDVVGTNGLSGLLRMWGVPIFIFFMVQIYLFFQIFNYSKIKLKVKIILWVSLLFVFFAQNIQYNFLTYLIIMSSIIYKYELTNARQMFPYRGNFGLPIPVRNGNNK